MAGLTADRNTPMKDGTLVSLPLAAGVKVYAGGIACVNVAGYAVPGAEDPKQVYVGRFEAFADNSLGANGGLSVLVRRGALFQFDNLAADPVTQASVGRDCYITDDSTVAASNGAANTRPTCGVVLAVDAAGVWVGERIESLRVASAPLDFVSIAAGSAAVLTIPYQGALPGDIVVLGLPAAPTVGLMFDAYVAANNVISVRAFNPTAFAVDALPAVYSVAIAN